MLPCYINKTHKDKTRCRGGFHIRPRMQKSSPCVQESSPCVKHQYTGENDMELPKRKSNRLQGYDYSKNGAYFVTICTHNRKILFGDVGADSISARMIDTVFNQTIKQYPYIECPKYVIMPNHFHAIIIINRADMESAPTTISEIVQSFKRQSTIEYINLVKQGLLPPFKKHI